MLVYVLNHHGKPLMPCSPAKARRLLKASKAKVVRRDPFTIKLLFGSSGYVQDVTAGVDTGSKTIGAAVIANSKVVYQAEIVLRNDVSGKMQQRAMYRRNRRGRKTRYRPARFNNRATMRADGRLAPSIRSKVESHLRERNFVESILPVRFWNVELASFDIHKITNPDVVGVAYQEGSRKGFYNIKAYVLNRDDYKCQSGQKCKHSPKLHVHHKVFRSQGGGDQPTNLITLCETCHDDLHAGKFSLKTKRSTTKHATEVGIIKGAIQRIWASFTATFGYETKWKREQCLGWTKSHTNDAVAICCADGEVVTPNPTVVHKRHVSKGDYQQTSGKRSEQRIPTGKLFGLRKFDQVSTPKGVGFVKGKRSSGYFAIADIDGTPIHNSARATSCVRMSARSTTLIRSG